jgi:glycosyltransferase involved in cell wall biosynthesis
VPGARLRVIGRGDDLPRLKELRDRAGLGDAVDFAGYVEDARLSLELNTCRLFALPSDREGFGLVYLEAMAHGRPCLGVRAGGSPEVITPVTGVLVEPGDGPGLAAACVAAMQRPWDSGAILARARDFSYSPFKAQLASLLAA